MPDVRTPLFVRLPRHQAAALDRLADATGRHKQHLVSELLADRLTPGAGPVSVGRVEVANTSEIVPDEVLTLEEAAAFLKLSTDTVRSRAEGRFARTAVLGWLADGETQKRRRTSPTERT
jgi:hypothetical protein